MCEIWRSGIIGPLVTLRPDLETQQLLPTTIGGQAKLQFSVRLNGEKPTAFGFKTG